ncbi:MAG: glutathione peroxidase [Bacteroidia bacterium]|nr:glutathione peroxidase [Bacteroidia bacterium]
MRNFFRTLIYPILTLFSCKEVKTKPFNETPMATKSFYDLSMKSIDGKEINFSVYKGKKVLIVNTASECGYTPQYKELQNLVDKYGNKIVVLGFPSNNFGAQEPGKNEDVLNFCKKNYGVTFQLFEKSDVAGSSKNAVYKWLTVKAENGWNEEEPKWNFSKYLINENGELIKTFSSAVSPTDKEIIDLL